MYVLYFEEYHLTKILQLDIMAYFFVIELTLNFFQKLLNLSQGALRRYWPYLFHQISRKNYFYRNLRSVRRRWQTRHDQFEIIIEQYSENDAGFYLIQIGACDGVMDDPIHKWIKKYRWNGILVEPQKLEFEKLRATYKDHPNLKFENVAIAEEDGNRILYKYKTNKIKADWQRGIASLLAKPDLEAQGLTETETVECITFDNLIKRNNVSRIDLLQIDTEGYDFHLLKLFNFRSLKPRLVRFEHRHLGFFISILSHLYLKQYGYRIFVMEFDTAAVLKLID